MRSQIDKLAQEAAFEFVSRGHGDSLLYRITDAVPHGFYEQLGAGLLTKGQLEAVQRKTQVEVLRMLLAELEEEPQ